MRVKYLRQKAEEKAAKALKSLGHPFEIHPGQALLDLVYEAAGNVAFLSSEMTKLEGQPLHTNSLEQGEMVRATVKLYGEWSDRLAKVSKMALDAGIDQRMVAIKEREADALLQAIEAITKALNLTPEQIKIARRSAASSFRITSRKVIDMPGVRNPGEVEPGNVAG